MNQNHVPPNSNFYSDFGHFILKTLEILKILQKCINFPLKIAISGGMSPQNFEPGEHVPSIPPLPPCGDAHVGTCIVYATSASMSIIK